LLNVLKSTEKIARSCAAARLCNRKSRATERERFEMAVAPKPPFAFVASNAFGYAANRKIHVMRAKSITQLPVDDQRLR